MFGIRALHYRGLLKQTKGYYGKFNTAFLNRNTFDLLFLGSSRAEMHYNTKLFDSLTGTNSFNLGVRGANSQVAFMALKTYLQQSKSPKHLIYEVDYHFLRYKNTEINEFPNYFPYLSLPEFRSQAVKIDPRITHFYYNPFYSLPYTGLKNLSTGLHGWFNVSNKTDSLYYKGYFKESLRPALGFKHIDTYYSFFNPTNRNYLDSIILVCKQKKIQLTLVSSPIFGGGKIEIVNRPQIIAQLKQIAITNSISYYDLSSLSFCNERKLFVDHYHLNYLGANEFTAFFCSVFNNKIVSVSLK